MMPSQTRLLYLDYVAGKVLSMSTDGTDKKVLVSGLKTQPDGVQFDFESGYVYYTLMGAEATEKDGGIERIKLDDSEEAKPEVVVPVGDIFTGKQLHLDNEGGKLYWGSREGGTVQRINLDGSNLEALYDAAPGAERPLEDYTLCPVGVAVDHKRQLLYWTQKGPSKGGKGRIFRANLEIPSGSTAENRKDVETLFKDLPEPIDLDLDAESQVLYWTDRGDPPAGNTVNRAEVAADLDPSREPKTASPEILSTHFHEAIGITRDQEEGKLYVADAMGSVTVMDLDGKNKRNLITDEGNYTGIALVKA